MTNLISFSNKVSDKNQVKETKQKNMNDKSIFSKTFEITIAVMIGIATLILGALAIQISLAQWAVNDKYDALNTKVDSRFEQINTSINSINQRFDYFEKYSDQKIENEVNKARLNK